LNKPLIAKDLWNIKNRLTTASIFDKNKTYGFIRKNLIMEDTQQGHGDGF